MDKILFVICVIMAVGGLGYLIIEPHLSAPKDIDEL